MNPGGIRCLCADDPADARAAGASGELFGGGERVGAGRNLRLRGRAPPECVPHHVPSVVKGNEPERGKTRRMKFIIFGINGRQYVPGLV